MRYLSYISLSILILIAPGCTSDDDQLIQPLDEFWVAESPENLGFDESALQEVMNEAERLANFKALLIIRGGKLAVEEYWIGSNVNSLHHLRSITKNFTSSMIGIALEQGEIAAVDASLADYYPDLNTSKAAITIRHLLNMSSGLIWDEDTEVLDLIEGRITEPVSDQLSRELDTIPGTLFNYNSASTHVLADLLSKQSNLPFEHLVEDQLFEPLGIADYQWDRDPNGAVWGGFGLQLTARDLAKLGQLYLNSGHWEGQQVIPGSWVSASSTEQILLPRSSTAGYSNQWWISKSLNTQLFYGQGYGGQGLMILPDEQMVVVVFQEHLVSGEQSIRQWRNFIDNVFLPLLDTVD